jgi:hypothetical protein
VLIALVIALSALAVRASIRATARSKREVGYQAALRTYSMTLHQGNTRKELEDHLLSTNSDFTWAFTAFGGRIKSQYADLVKLGGRNFPFLVLRRGRHLRGLRVRGREEI